MYIEHMIHLSLLSSFGFCLAIRDTLRHDIHIFIYIMRYTCFLHLDMHVFLYFVTYT